MKFNILGSGGAVALPRPFCHCQNCTKARTKGIPYERTGPSMYIYGHGGILFDTPEEIRLQIEAEKIRELSHVFFTHWHPDHTQGLRVFEHIKHVYQANPAKNKIQVYIPKNDIENFQKFCGALWYYESQGYITIVEVDDREPIAIGNIFVTPIDFKRPELDRVRYGYLIVDGKKKVLYAPCSTFNMQVDHYFDDLDCLIMETGWLGKTAQTRASLPAGHTWLDHVSFEENIELIELVKPKCSILTHIDGCRHLSDSANHDKLQLLATEEMERLDLDIKIAYDGMKIEI